MNTDGSSALKLAANPKQTEMEEYLSSEGGYWLKNDVWRTDAEAYRAAGMKDAKTEGELLDFSEYKDSLLKTELKYFLLYGLRNGWKSRTMSS